MELTKSTEEDINTVVKLWYKLAKDMEEYSELNELSYNNYKEVPLEGFQKHLESEEVTNFLIQEAKNTVGFVTLQTGQHSSRKYSKYIKIMNIFVRKDCRNKGYGTAVIEKVKEIAQEQGCDHLKVSFEFNNKDARRFYDENSFTEKQIESVYKID